MPYTKPIKTHNYLIINTVHSYYYEAYAILNSQFNDLIISIPIEHHSTLYMLDFQHCII